MASLNFEPLLKEVLKSEGGYVNHPRDPGGATNKGVTQRTYDMYRRDKGLPTRTVRKITTAEVALIYKNRYWDRVSGDQMPSGLDYVAFDAGVNSGPSRGVKWLQRAVGATPDGQAGPATIAAARSSDWVAAVKKACRIRMSFLRSLRHWGTFGKGWSRRVAHVEARSVQLAAAAMSVDVTAVLEKEEKAAASIAKKQQTGAHTTAGGTAAAAPTAATQIEPTAWADPTVLTLFGMVTAAALVAAGALYLRSFINKRREEAYRAIALEEKAGF